MQVGQSNYKLRLQIQIPCLYGVLAIAHSRFSRVIFDPQLSADIIADCIQLEREVLSCYDICYFILYAAKYENEI